jgi:hypothetical protein
LGIGFNGGYGGPQIPVRRMERVVVDRREEMQRPKTSGSVQGVKVWLRKVTSLERLRA